MEVKKLKDKPTNILRSIGDTHISDVYLLDDKKTVFKQFRDTENLTYIRNLHPNFPEYIRFLESLHCDALQLPETLYCNGFLRTRIDSYSYPYVDGMEMDHLHPKTNIRRLIHALYEFDKELDKCEGAIYLKDAHPGNILYTGKAIKLIDVDFYKEPKKSDYLSNRKLINSGILEYLLDDNSFFFMYEYPDLFEQYNKCLRGEISLAHFLETFVAYIELTKDIEVEHIRDIRRRGLAA